MSNRNVTACVGSAEFLSRNPLRATKVQEPAQRGPQIGTEKLGLDFALCHRPTLRRMPNTPKVVPFDQHRFRVIAADEKTNRIRRLDPESFKCHQTPPNAANFGL